MAPFGKEKSALPPRQRTSSLIWNRHSQIAWIGLRIDIDPDGGDILQMVNYCTAFNDRYMMFSIVYP